MYTHFVCISSINPRFPIIPIPALSRLEGIAGHEALVLHSIGVGRFHEISALWRCHGGPQSDRKVVPGWFG